MTLKELREKRARLLREAEALKQADGTFKDDATRTAFDVKMGEVDAVDAEIRTAEAAPSGDPVTARAEATKLERDRNTGIRTAVRAAGLGDSVADEMISAGTPLDQARAQVLEQLAEKQRQTPTNDANRGAVVTDDEAEKWNRGVEAWLYQKAGVAQIVRQAAAKGHPAFANVSLEPGEFRGLSLLDLCRMSLDRRGIKTTGMDKMAIAGRAMTLTRDSGVLGAQTTSDFTVSLETALHKTLLASFVIVPDSWRRFSRVGSVSDFRAHNRYRLGYLGRLDRVLESGEFKNKAIPDTTKESIAAVTRGNIIALSRQAIVNDDMGVFNQIAAQAGRAAALSVEMDVYDLLAENAGLGPVMGDGNTLFHASHGNIGSNSALTVAGLEADSVLLASQTDASENEFLNLMPGVLLVPIGLRGTALVLNDAAFDPDTPNKLQMPNRVRGLVQDIVGTPRLTGTRRYLFADPAIMPVIEVAFLEGQQEPFLEMKDGWRIDGVEWKVRLDYGVAAIEWRGAVTNAGA